MQVARLIEPYNTVRKAITHKTVMSSFQTVDCSNEHLLDVGTEVISFTKQEIVDIYKDDPYNLYMTTMERAGHSYSLWYSTTSDQDRKRLEDTSSFLAWTEKELGKYSWVRFTKICFNGRNSDFKYFVSKHHRYWHYFLECFTPIPNQYLEVVREFTSAEARKSKDVCVYKFGIVDHFEILDKVKTKSGKQHYYVAEVKGNSIKVLPLFPHRDKDGFSDAAQFVRVASRKELSLEEMATSPIKAIRLLAVEIHRKTPEEACENLLKLVNWEQFGRKTRAMISDYTYQNRRLLTAFTEAQARLIPDNAIEQLQTIVKGMKEIDEKIKVLFPKEP